MPRRCSWQLLCARARAHTHAHMSTCIGSMHRKTTDKDMSATKIWATKIWARAGANSLTNHNSLCTGFAEVLLRECINPVISVADVLVAATLLWRMELPSVLENTLVREHIRTHLVSATLLWRMELPSGSNVQMFLHSHTFSLSLSLFLSLSLALAPSLSLFLSQHTHTRTRTRTHTHTHTSTRAHTCSSSAELEHIL